MNSMNRSPAFTWIAPALVALCIFQAARSAETQHNVILFVPDGLRADVVDARTAPALAALRREGVNFTNSHSIFPTFTTANASAFATGHLPGDTGDFSNTIDAGFPVANAGASITPFLENDDVIRELNQHFGGNYLNELTVMGAARQGDFSTASIGKLGPVLIQDPTPRWPAPTIVMDDDTGNGGLPLAPEITAAIKAARLRPGPPPRSDFTPNVAQQKYFADVLIKVVLPRFKTAKKPFFVVFWSRDPDGTQHNQNDSDGKLVPGINGPSSLAAIRNADANLSAIRGALQVLGLAGTTDIIVSSDHGFSTVAKMSKTSTAARYRYNGPVEVPPGTLPPGFLAIDLADALKLPLYDTDHFNLTVDFRHGDFPKRGNGAIGNDAKNPAVVVAANGGSDLIYLPNATGRALLRRITSTLLKEDYVGGIFVDDGLGAIDGTLALSAIGLSGQARTPRPSIVVNFRSFDTGCANVLLCAVEISDTVLLTGQGIHGSLDRADTKNFMAAVGPDFKANYRDDAPASNADIGMTIAHILHLQLSSEGRQTGRVLDESLAGGPAAIKSERRTMRSRTASGVATVLETQSVGGFTYLDSARLEYTASSRPTVTRP